MMRIFIDTEFTDFIDCHLISLGMVSEFGDEFYCEVPYPDKACSAFVHEVIIPLLNQDTHARRGGLIRLRDLVTLVGLAPLHQSKKTH